MALAAPGPPADRPAPDGGRFSPDIASRVHSSLLAGLLSHIGMQDLDRNPAASDVARRSTPARAAPASPSSRAPRWPGSRRAGWSPPSWSRPRGCGPGRRAIEPEWVEPLAGHLVKRSYSEPHWEARRGAVMAYEKVTLYGLPLVAARQVSYGRIDPEAARELFIRHALVEGDWPTHHRFFHDNRRLLAEAEELEHRARRRDIVVDDEAAVRLLRPADPRGRDVGPALRRLVEEGACRRPRPADFSAADLAGPAAAQVRPADYPSSWGELPLSYEFAPGAPDDGVTVHIPLAGLNQVNGADFGWQVPGLREELVTELIRSLPKQLRTAFVPAPQTARAVLERLGPPRGDLLDALAAELGRRSGTAIPREAWNLSRLPAYLTITYRVLDGDRVLASGKDLAELQRQLQPRLQAELSEAARGITRSGLRTWDFDTLPRVFTDQRVRGYPALEDAGDAVDIRLFQTSAQASEAMWRGNRRLLLLAVPAGVRSVASRLPVTAKLAMSRSPYPNPAALLDDCAACAADQVIAEAGGPAWDAAGFAQLLETARTALPVAAADVVSAVARVLAEAHQVEASLGATAGPMLAAAFADMRAQLSGLIYPGFIAETGSKRLPDLARYLTAIGRRLEKAPADPRRDAERMAIVRRVTDAYQRASGGLPAAGRDSESARTVRWMIEELRVSLFAQALGTPVPVSEQRIQKALDQLAS